MTGVFKLDYRHERGMNCTTTSMMNVFRFHGFDLSEELCLGIGAGLGFTYVRGLRVPFYLVFGRSDDLEINVSRAVGAHLSLCSDTDPRAAWREVLDELRTTGPVLLDTDVSKMPYTARSLAWPEIGSHGGHKIVVTGWNADTEEAEVCDYLWPRARWIPVQELFRAWVSDSGPMMRTYHFWYRLVLPGRYSELPDAIREGVRTNLFRMREPWNKFFGVEALKAFLLGVTGWRYSLPPERLRVQAYSTYVALEIGGSGKGAFRRMYARFLREAAAILGEPELGALAEAYVELARRWSALAELLRQASEDPERGLFSGDTAHDVLTRDLWRGELAALDRLQSVAERWD
jgi:hypothetical protein